MFLIYQIKKKIFIFLFINKMKKKKKNYIYKIKHNSKRFLIRIV